MILRRIMFKEILVKARPSPMPVPEMYVQNPIDIRRRRRVTVFSAGRLRGGDPADGPGARGLAELSVQKGAGAVQEEQGRPHRPDPGRGIAQVPAQGQLRVRRLGEG